MTHLQESARVRFRGGRFSAAGKSITSRYDVYAYPPESLVRPGVPGYLGVVVRYADGLWFAVARNGWQGKARTRREAVRQAWWWRYA